MPRKLANLTYGVEDKPSTAVSFVLSLQHAVLLIGSVTAGILFGKEAGLANEQIQALVTLCLVVPPVLDI
jgi:xanthine/uracil permease